MALKVLILVGGETTGTRFRPLSMEGPKLLFPICGKPLITHIIDSLVEQLSDEISEILLIGFFKDSSVFQNYIKQVNSVYPKLKIKYLTEPKPLGTAGGLYHFREEIFTSQDCKLLMIHGDVICDYPFKKMLESYDKEKSNITLFGLDPVTFTKKSSALSNASGEVPDDEFILQNYGAIVAKRSTSDIIHYVEKPSSTISMFRQDTKYRILLNGGIYIFDRSIVDLLQEAKIKKETSNQLVDDVDLEDSKSNVLSLELDVFKTLPQVPETKFTVYQSDDFWYQLKSPVSALLANNFFLAKGACNTSVSTTVEILKPVQILDSDLSQAGSSKIGPNVSIGKNVTIGSGVRLANCIIADDVSIGDNTIIKNAIVSSGAKIGKWCRIEGTITSQTLAENANPNASEGYLKLLNNIVILCQGTVVKSQVFVYNSVVLPHKELKNDIKYEIIM
ncbi:uncharacterized protein SPAPADRAFT_61543 [Spathaspora passalidarum NRRL Y-27907]|uniref:mannose-1-phosphate guanylyltransferase n=1 Tax=Spathaspora passalidarum (strain NRRL Y-27907 / 11-Y1) TaxID=619300 RepID=G3AN93_SPAPN|nr:uncharacterized protein SPAPADRAFT_61543 [Spathaspora passalidarum NRRL Y-27907]EGW32476.1 hypothetical protein SPAPADRAFT_61543 [Spathaspora passalidarum NRRL Y-27907]